MTREEMIQTVHDVLWNAEHLDAHQDNATQIVDALHPRQRNSVPLPDGGRMEWHEKEHSSWRRFNNLGELRESYVYLTTHGLDDDLHAECYALKNKEWVEDVSNDVQAKIADLEWRLADAREARDIYEKLNTETTNDNFALQARVKELESQLQDADDALTACQTQAKAAIGKLEAAPAPTKARFRKGPYDDLWKTADDASGAPYTDAESKVWQLLGAWITSVARPDAEIAPTAEMVAAIKALANTPVPTKATPLGFALFHEGDHRYGSLGVLCHSAEAARRVWLADKDEYIEHTPPVFRHAQTEAELVAAFERCGYTHGIVEMNNKRVTYHSFLKGAVSTATVRPASAEGCAHVWQSYSNTTGTHEHCAKCFTKRAGGGK